MMMFACVECVCMLIDGWWTCEFFDFPDNANHKIHICVFFLTARQHEENVRKYYFQSYAKLMGHKKVTVQILSKYYKQQYTLIRTHATWNGQFGESMQTRKRYSNVSIDTNTQDGNMNVTHTHTRRTSVTKRLFPQTKRWWWWHIFCVQINV